MQQTSKSTIGKGEEIFPGEMMIMHDMNNNILIYGTSYLGGYQDEYEKWELYKEINIFGVILKKNCWTCGARN